MSQSKKSWSSLRRKKREEVEFHKILSSIKQSDWKRFSRFNGFYDVNSLKGIMYVQHMKSTSWNWLCDDRCAHTHTHTHTRATTKIITISTTDVKCFMVCLRDDFNVFPVINHHRSNQLQRDPFSFFLRNTESLWAFSSSLSLWVENKVRILKHTKLIQIYAMR